MEEKNYIEVRVLEIAGMAAALQALRLPFGKEVRSVTYHDWYMADGRLMYKTSVTPHEKDMELMRKLVLNGDEHAKVVRGIMVWMEINAPRYWWQEMDTYRVGTDRLSSESTMHMQGKGLATEELISMKEALTEGTMQKRVQVFSYQTLRRIYMQRRNHRLPHWQQFCEVIKVLPYAAELILTERGKEVGNGIL